MKFLLRTFFCAIIFFYSFSKANAQVLINEFSASNASSITDESGDSPDWIELYNAGSSSASILNYGLSDSTSNLYKLRFPDVSIPSHQFMLVFASRHNKTNVIDHWE